MAYDSNLQSISLVAGEDLSSSQYRFVKLNAAGAVIRCTVQGEFAAGVLQNKPTSGQIAEVGFNGVSKIVLGNTVVGTDQLMTDTAGRAIPAVQAATPGSGVIGFPIVGGAVNEIGSILVVHTGYYVSVDSDHAAVLLNTAHRTGDGTDHSALAGAITHATTDGKSHSDVVLNNTHRTSNGSDHSQVVTALAHVTADGKSHADVVLNNTHRTSDGKDHSDVVLNNTHRTSNGADHSQVVTALAHVTADGKSHADVVLNNAHRVADGKDHSDVVLNNAHRVADGKDHSDVVLNNAHRVGTGEDHTSVAGAVLAILQNVVHAVITVANATGGATTSALTCNLLDFVGNALAKTGVYIIIAADSEYGGWAAINTHCTFGTATKGSILGTGTGWVTVKADVLFIPIKKSRKCILIA